MEILQAQLQLRIDEFTNSLQQAAQRFAQFAQTVTAQLSQVSQALAGNSTATQQTAAANNALLIAMQNLQNTSRQQSATLQQLSAQMAQNSQGAQQNTQSTNQLAASYLAMAQAINQQSQAYTQAQQAALAFRQQQASAAAVTQQAAAAAREAGAAWQQMFATAGGLGIATSIQGIVAALVAFGKSVVTVGANLQLLRVSLGAIANDASAGARQFQFLVDTSQRLGFGIESLVAGYRGLVAATMQTSLGLEGAQRIFTGVTEAVRVMGGSTTQAQRALLALEQMVSKGTVSMEELRRQLGNALPGAFNMAATAMGVTTEKLNEMVKSGETRSIPFVQAFTRYLHEEFGPKAEGAAKTATAAFARFGNEILLLKDSIAQSGVLSFLAEVTDKASGMLKVFREGREAQAQLKNVLQEEAVLNTGLRTKDFDPAVLQRLAQIRALTRETQSAAGATTVADPRINQALQEEAQALIASTVALRDKRLEQEKLTASARQARAERERDADLVSNIQEKMKQLTKAEEDLVKSSKATPEVFGSLAGSAEKKIEFLTNKIKILRDNLEEITKLEIQRPAMATTSEADAQQKTAVQRQLQMAEAQKEAIQQSIRAEAAAERQGERLREKAVRDAARLAEDRKAITEKMMQAIAEMEGTFQDKQRRQVEETLAEARRTSADIVTTRRFERDMVIQFAMEETDMQTEFMHKRVQAATEALKEENAAIDRQHKALDTLARLGQADDTIEKKRLAGMQQIEEQRKILTRDGLTTKEQLNEATESAITAVNQQALEERQKQEDQAAKKALEPWVKMAHELQSTLSNAFEAIFTKTNDVWASIKKAFLKLIADLAAAMVTNQVLIPAAMGLAASLGIGASQGFGGGSIASTEGSGGGGGAGSVMGSVAGFAQGGASIYSGVSGNSLLGSTGLLSGLMGTELGEFGISGAGYIGGAEGSLGGLSGTTIGTIAGGVGAGIASGMIISKLNSLMGLHGVANTTLSGASGGAIAGSIILPGVGTAIGAVVGAIGGAIAGLLKKDAPQPGFQIQGVRAGQIGYDETLGLRATQDFATTKDFHTHLGTKYEPFIGAVNDAINANFTSIVSQLQGFTPEVQQALIDPMNAAFRDIATQISSQAKISGKNFKDDLGTLFETTIPTIFKSAADGVLKRLQDAAAKIDPVIQGFSKVIDALQQDIAAIHQQQIQLDNAMQAAANTVKTALYSPAESYLFAKQQYEDLKGQFAGGNEQQRILLAPQIAQFATQLLSLAKSEDVLGQDEGLVRELQASLMSDIGNAQSGADSGFQRMQDAVQEQVVVAQNQIEALKNSFRNLDSVDAVITNSLDVLHNLQDLIANDQNDPLVQAQVLLLGGLTNIGASQLQVLQDISSKLGGAPGFAGGEDYIPYDTFARLHRGERVLTAAENANGGNGTLTMNIQVSGDSVGGQEGAGQIADAVIREIEKRSGRYSTTKILTRR